MQVQGIPSTPAKFPETIIVDGVFQEKQNHVSLTSLLVTFVLMFISAGRPLELGVGRSRAILEPRLLRAIRVVRMSQVLESLQLLLLGAESGSTTSGAMI